LNYNLNESCIKPVKVEAEWSNGRWQSAAQDFSTIRAVRVSDIDSVSGNGYLEVLPSSSGANPSVSFELPDVLAARYEIHCVCVAQSYVETIKDTTQYLTRLQFEIQQWNKLTDKSLSASWTTIQSFSDQTTDQYVTRPIGISDILVTSDFLFPFANFHETDNVFRLKVTSAPSSADLRDPAFNKEIRIDYILLESSSSNETNTIKNKNR